MQQGQVDICITGTDRTTRSGDVANKIGTYLKALSAKDNLVPFYVALPSTTIDWSITDGISEILIEERNPAEVTHITGLDGDEIRYVLDLGGNLEKVLCDASSNGSVETYYVHAADLCFRIDASSSAVTCFHSDGAANVV